MAPEKLTTNQKKRLKILEPKLKLAIEVKDYRLAKSLVQDLQSLLRPSGHTTRLAQYKIRLYELALENNNLNTAIEGLSSVRKIVSQKTRLYLEATALLAICYLRLKDLENAKPLIREVLTNNSAIKTERTRKEFRVEIINRFDQEIALFSIRKKEEEILSEEELEKNISELLMSNKNEKELLIYIGKNAPRQTKDLLYQVHQFSINLLPSAERIALYSPEEKIKDRELGKTVFQSVKRVIYNSICNPESEVYKAWYTNGAAMVLSKGYLRATVLAGLSKIGIGITMFSAYVIALVIKVGLEVFCDYNKPLDLMNLRGK